MQITLADQVRAHPNIQLMERFNAVDLIHSRVLRQATACSEPTSGTAIAKKLRPCARFVALATGGPPKVYQYTSNPDVSSGDGIATWLGALGCRVANMEFNQFHPTTYLLHPDDRNFC